MSNVVKVYGLRRSGTNYFSKIVGDNYDCRDLHDKEGGWKHGTVTHEDQFPEVDSIGIVRNPQSWLPSIHRLEKAEKRVSMPFAEWAAGDWKRQGDRSTPMRREGYPGYAPLMNTWNRQLGYWLWRGVPIVKYEDVLVNPEMVCDELAGRMGWERTTETFSVPGDYVAPYERGDGRKDILRRHKCRTYLDQWDGPSRQALETSIDPVLMEEVGYELDWEKPEVGPGEQEESPYDGDVYWIMRGGAGDLVMNAHGMKKVLNAGWEIDLFVGSTYSKWLSPILDEWDGLTLLDEPPEEGAYYRIVACDTNSSTLQKRTDHMEYDHMINPNSFSGTPAEWSEDIANQILDIYKEVTGEDADRSDVYNILRDQLPHQRYPKRVLVGAGSGSGGNSEKKHWDIGCWREVCEAAPVEFRWLGVGQERPPQWSECPICGAALDASGGDGMPSRQACSEGCGWEVTDYVGKTDTIHDVMEELADGALYVGVDNGLGHLAAACGLPTITVFGETRPDRYRPNTCNSLTFGEKGRFPDSEPVADAVGRMFGPVEDPLVSVVIATCNEGEELLPTVECARLKGGCPVGVVVVDDGGDDDSMDHLPDWVITDRNDQRTGVAPARQQASEMASGDVLVFWDGHMRWSTGCGREMARKALEDNCVVMAPLRNLYGSNRNMGGANFKLDKGKKILNSHFTGMPGGSERYHRQSSFVAPCYAIPTEIFQAIGGWPSGLKNWGQTEITLSLKVTLAGYETYLDTEVTMWHRFRSSFAYSGVSITDKMRNNYRMCRICFDEDTFEEFWLPLMEQHRYHREEWNEQDEADREAFQEVKEISDEEFFQQFLGMSVEEAKEKYL